MTVLINFLNEFITIMSLQLNCIISQNIINIIMKLLEFICFLYQEFIIVIIMKKENVITRKLSKLLWRSKNKSIQN